jgi:F-type H+-transporting ATPase subunit delta
MTVSATATTPDSTERSLLADNQVELVRHYAEALVNAATGEGQPEASLDDLSAIEDEVLKKFPRLRQLLASDRVSPARKDQLLVEVFGDRVSNLVLRFLRVLNRHGRLGLLTAVSREARQIWDRRHKRVPVYVRVAVPLDQEQEMALREQVAAMISANPVLHVTTDPSLIGGLIVQVGDQVCDASLRNHLEQLRKRLIEGKTHEIQSRRDQFSNPA